MTDHIKFGNAYPSTQLQCPYCAAWLAVEHGQARVDCLVCGKSFERGKRKG